MHGPTCAQWAIHKKTFLVKRKDLQGSTLVSTTRVNLVMDSLPVQHLDNRLYILQYFFNPHQAIVVLS